MGEERAKPIDIPLQPVKLTSEEETDFHLPATHAETWMNLRSRAATTTSSPMN
jgi:hypothetical protein